jgi:hypothetical protein
MNAESFGGKFHKGTHESIRQMVPYPLPTIRAVNCGGNAIATDPK